MSEIRPAGGAGAGGDIVGPASATDGAPALFDGTTGKLLKNSTPTGTGNPVLAASPTLVSPALGTPSALVLTNATGLPTAGLVDEAVTLAKMANLTGPTVIGKDTGTGVPVALTPAQLRVVAGGEETATAGSAVTTLTLTPSATLTDGIYEVDISILSGGPTSNLFSFYINGDTTTSNYRFGFILCLSGSGSAYFESGTGINAFVCDENETIFVRMNIAIKNGNVIWNGTQAEYRADNIGRTGVVSGYHISATEVTSLQITASVASDILTGSFITLRRVG